MTAADPDFMTDGDPASRIRVLVADEQGRPMRAPGLTGWLARVAPSRARGTVHVALVSDTRVRALNRQYRRQDYTTDVLSFPAENAPPRGTQGNRGSTRSPRALILSPSKDEPWPTFRLESFLGDIVGGDMTGEHDGRA